MYNWVVRSVLPDWRTRLFGVRFIFLQEFQLWGGRCHRTDCRAYVAWCASVKWMDFNQMSTGLSNSQHMSIASVFGETDAPHTPHICTVKAKPKKKPADSSGQSQEERCNSGMKWLSKYLSFYPFPTFSRYAEEGNDTYSMKFTPWIYKAYKALLSICYRDYQLNTSRH